MKKFILIYHSSPESLEQMASATPEQIAASMQPWFDWKARCGDHMVDFGAPLMGGQKILADGSSQPSTKEVSGYSIIQAPSVEDAKKLLVNHPHNQIEMHEFAPM